ncbi:MAG: polysaccharide biosynthesis C-terminal domain-containing protein, partial [Alkaliphilus sp.]|nr:polysaccharide biosynthesis C-terminal domain-containing protein [Alkaliphilus sp.]
EFIQSVLKPVISVSVMGITVYSAYRLVSSVAGNTVSTIAAIAVGGIVYGLMLFITGTIMEEDFLIFPKGDRMAEFLRRFNLLRK